MKQYIRAAYDASAPKWLRNSNEYNKAAVERLNFQYAMSQAKFYRDPQPNSIPIHLLYEVYKREQRRGEYYYDDIPEYVYVPSESGAAYNIFVEYGSGKFRSLPNVAKSKLNQHIVDTVYMVAPKRAESRQGRDYVDPRYEKDSWAINYPWKYAGQTPEYEETWNRETHRYERTNKISSWNTTSGRDKSGYKIPNPEDLYAKLYQRFPNIIQTRLNKVKGILDEYYDKIDAAKNLIFSQYDIRKGKAISMYGRAYDTPFYHLHDAIYTYGQVYSTFEKCINEDGSIDSKKLADFVNGNGYDGLSHKLSAIDDSLDKINRYLD